jgi:hypothetical protein
MCPERPVAGADQPPAPASVISARLLGHVRALNRAYVDLLAGSDDAALGPAAADLSADVLAALAGLDDAGRERVAACSFSLFGLGLEDADFWVRAGVARIADLPHERYGHTAVDRFLATALFLAWHVAQSNELVGRFLLAMPARTHHAMRRLSPAHLHAIALAHPQLLRPRWPDNPCFWPDLLAFAASGDQPGLDAARLLGIQLIAAEIEPDVIRRPSRAGATTTRRPRR